jgi:hypothetical protein
VSQWGPEQELTVKISAQHSKVHDDLQLTTLIERASMLCHHEVKLEPLQALAVFLLSRQYTLDSCIVSNSGRYKANQLWKVKLSDGSLRVIKQSSCNLNAARSAKGEAHNYGQLHTMLGTASSNSLLCFYSETIVAGETFLELELAECTLKQFVQQMHDNGGANQNFARIRSVVLSALSSFQEFARAGCFTEGNIDNLLIVAADPPLQIHSDPVLFLDHVLKIADLNSCMTFMDNFTLPAGSLSLKLLLHYLSASPDAKGGAAKSCIYHDQRLKVFFTEAGKISRKTLDTQQDQLMDTQRVYQLAIETLGSDLRIHPGLLAQLEGDTWLSTTVRRYITFFATNLLLFRSLTFGLPLLLPK